MEIRTLRVTNAIESEVIIRQGSEGNAFSLCECKDLFGCELFMLMRKIKEFLPNYKKITNTDEKQYSLLLSFLTSIVEFP